MWQVSRMVECDVGGGAGADADEAAWIDGD